MWKKFCIALSVVGVTGLAACVSGPTERDYRAYPDDYRLNPDDHRANSRTETGDVVVTRERRYNDNYDRYGDRDGDGVLNWRDRYPDDSRRF